MRILVFTLVALLVHAFSFAQAIPENMVLISKGEFMMGSSFSPEEIQERYGYEFTQSIKDSWKLELPLHQVKIDKDFCISINEVTVQEFEKFVLQTGYLTDAENGISSHSYNGQGDWTQLDSINWRNPGLWVNQPEYPVVLVSWNDANAYAKWYGTQLNMPCRLPTEQEWEYVTYTNENHAFTWGNDPKKGQGKLNALDRYFGMDDGYKYVAPVGSFTPNEKGLHDLLGNVWEWCSSPFVKQYPIVENSPEADEYVDRGGGWDSPPFNARRTTRGAANSKFNAINLGFRIVCDCVAN